MTLTPSHIIEYLFCPRFTYFEYVLGIPQYEDKNYKVMRGRHLHDERLERNKDYLRRRLGRPGAPVVEKLVDQYLTNAFLRGVVDEVLAFGDESMAPLDYKFAEYKDKIFSTYQTQLYCYAWLIEDNFDRRVDRGFLVYTRSNNRVVEVPITDENKADVRRAAEAIFSIIDRNFFPKATKAKARCVTCTYRNVCIK
ncbi:CRISPR-associated protein Cas4 [Spirosoma montaniterrae]|uniref:CRISPR-associated exonuclease Cas4 n=1 Tax=Spirosoma montaniterrae TaxID=1178516 RepID=A0A1P9WYK6_9BACT|nr:CRISPR-associated protein Cas4 [Spirosoma montaniterrae]AQG80461.1 CRISPR-associated protein Cas4 [Spirosoma montaniterrae]